MEINKINLGQLNHHQVLDKYLVYILEFKS